MNTTQPSRPVTTLDKWTGEVLDELPRASERDLEKAGTDADLEKKNRTRAV